MTCRACRSENLEEVIDMGEMPLAGDFHGGMNAKRYPLQIDHCSDCDCVQVRQDVPHEVLFNDQYCYASSTVPSLCTHFKELGDYIRSSVPRGIVPRVLEIGCNDGVLLTHLENGIGVDSSKNVVDIAKANGLNAHCYDFSGKTAPAIFELSGKVNMIVCSNIFAHNADPGDFLQGIRYILEKSGMGSQVIIEVHSAAALLARNQWDCFYHEHKFYWTAEALARILDRNGLILLSTRFIDVHGGSLRIRATFKNSDEPHLANWAIGERQDWKKFKDTIERSSYILGKSIGHYTTYLIAAAGRATTLVNYSNIGGKIIAAFDGSPLRIGTHIPGTSIPILDEKLLCGVGNYSQFLLGAWHLEDKLIQKIKKAVPNNAGIITPLPYVKIQ